MKKAIFILLFFFVYQLNFSQEKFEKVTKQYTFETGYQYIFKSNFDSVSAGAYTFMFDYAWKLSGYNKKSNAYISVPLGYAYHPAGNSEAFKSASILFYGWTVRHELLKNKKVIPYFGYALLLNQFKYYGTEGSIFGHQTKFEFGTNFSLKERLILFAKLEYSFGRFPSLAQEISNKIHTAEFKVGIRF